MADMHAFIIFTVSLFTIAVQTISERKNTVFVLKLMQI